MKSGKLYIDIETLPPLLWAEHERTAYVASKVPGQFKRPESIATWCQEHYEETWSRAALDWRISRIACIGVPLGVVIVLRPVEPVPAIV